MHIFSDIRYYLSPSLDTQDHTVLEALLVANGGIKETVQCATHIITNSLQFEGWQAVGENVVIVTPNWVKRSIVLGKCQQPKFYSADPSMLFSGVVACATDVIPEDVEVLTGAICALGGQWRSGLTRDVTHLFALNTASEKYQTAMHYQKDTRIKVLAPHWFDDVVRLGIANIPTLLYEWPDPQVLRPGNSVGQDTKQSRKPTESQASVYKSAILGNGSDTAIPDRLAAGAERCDVWKGKKILLSRTLDLSPGRLEAVKAGVERFGGILIDDARSRHEESNKIDEADVLIARYRSGAAYIKALKSKEKLVGSLSWLFHVHTARVITPPTDQLLHYPIPEAKIVGFERHEITITNYTGGAREYLKRLIGVMGAKFTASMSPRNTVVIAAFTTGNKTDRAQHWSIPIVNHTWLEDCFVRWKDLSVGLEKYVRFPPGVDFSVMLGEKGVGRKVLLEDAELDVPESSNSSAVMEVDMNLAPQSSAMEVEEAVLLNGNDDDGDVTMANQVDIEEKITVEKEDIPHGEPEDDPMQSSIPPPPKKLVRRVVRRRQSASPEPVTPKTKGDLQDSPGLSSRMQGQLFGSKKRTPREKMTRDDLEYSPSRPSKSATSSDEKDFSAPSTSKLPSRSGTSATETNRRSELGDMTDDQYTSSTRHSKKTMSTTAGETKAAARRRSLRSSPLKPRAMETDNATDEEAVISSRTLSKRTAALQTPEHAKTRTVTKTQTLPVTETPSQHGSSPRRVLSVIVPPLPDYLSPSKRNNKSPASLRKDPSLRVQAAEALIQKAKRGRPSTTNGKHKTTRPNEERSESSGDITVRDMHDAEPQKQIEAEAEVFGGRTRRTAASKATQKLRDEIMPDVMKYEKEVRRGVVVNEWEDTDKDKGKGRTSRKRVSGTGDDEDDNEEKPERKRPKLSDTKSKTPKTKKTASRKARETSNDEEHDDEVEPGNKTAGTKKHRRKEQTPSSGSDDDNDGAQTSTNPADIRLMTTKVVLPDDTAKVLSKMGVKTAGKPSECTHLIAKDFGRTEKILCAIAVRPYILTTEWAIKSAAKKRIQPEKEYLLTDKEAEGKYRFTMADSLRRARKNRGKMLDGKTFYVTPRVAVDIKLLKNTVAAHGGLVLHQAPTLRILSGKDNRYTISCEEDISIWRPLAEQGYPIYTKELLLTGILTQNMGFEDEGYKLEGSY